MAGPSGAPKAFDNSILDGLYSPWDETIVGAKEFTDEELAQVIRFLDTIDPKGKEWVEDHLRVLKEKATGETRENLQRLIKAINERQHTGYERLQEDLEGNEVMTKFLKLFNLYISQKLLKEGVIMTNGYTQSEIDMIKVILWGQVQKLLTPSWAMGALMQGTIGKVEKVVLWLQWKLTEAAKGKGDENDALDTVTDLMSEVDTMIDGFEKEDTDSKKQVQDYFDAKVDPALQSIISMKEQEKKKDKKDQIDFSNLAVLSAIVSWNQIDPATLKDMTPEQAEAAFDTIRDSAKGVGDTFTKAQGIGEKVKRMIDKLPDWLRDDVKAWIRDIVNEFPILGFFIGLIMGPDFMEELLEDTSKKQKTAIKNLLTYSKEEKSILKDIDGVETLSGLKPENLKEFFVYLEEKKIDYSKDNFWSELFDTKKKDPKTPLGSVQAVLWFEVPDGVALFSTSDFSDSAKGFSERLNWLKEKEQAYQNFQSQAQVVAESGDMYTLHVLSPAAEQSLRESGQSLPPVPGALEAGLTMEAFSKRQAEIQQYNSIVDRWNTELQELLIQAKAIVVVPPYAWIDITSIPPYEAVVLDDTWSKTRLEAYIQSVTERNVQVQARNTEIDTLLLTLPRKLEVPIWADTNTLPPIPELPTIDSSKVEIQEYIDAVLSFNQSVMELLGEDVSRYISTVQWFDEQITAILSEYTNLWVASAYSISRVSDTNTIPEIQTHIQEQQKYLQALRTEKVKIDTELQKVAQIWALPIVQGVDLWVVPNKASSLADIQTYITQAEARVRELEADQKAQERENRIADLASQRDAHIKIKLESESHFPIIFTYPGLDRNLAQEHGVQLPSSITFINGKLEIIVWWETHRFNLKISRPGIDENLFDTMFFHDNKLYVRRTSVDGGMWILDSVFNRNDMDTEVPKDKLFEVFKWLLEKGGYEYKIPDKENPWTTKATLTISW